MNILNLPKKVALKESFEKSGNVLFRYRSFIPVLILLTTFPVIAITPDNDQTSFFNVVSVALSLAGIVLRAYTIGTTPRGTSGRNTQKQVAESLNTNGIYSLVRHPLYLGNYLMWAGLALYTYNIWYFIVISLIFWIYYERIMFAEEAYLRGKFGGAFEEWSSRVPAFIPRLKGFQPPTMSFSVKSVLRREYSGILALAAVYFVIDYFRLWIMEAPLLGWRPTSVVLVITALLALVLRNLKHHTRLLSESNRS